MKSDACDASLFELDENSSIPLWLQLKNRFIYLITSGYYKPDDKLPTVRGLAADIEVNYNTISKVYKSLEADGYIESKRRQGAFVCDVSDQTRREHFCDGGNRDNGICAPMQGARYDARGHRDSICCGDCA